MKRILVAVDEDPQAKKVIEQAGELAQKLDAALFVCHIMPTDAYRRIEERQVEEKVEHPLSITDAEQQARATAAELAEGLKAFNVPFETKGAVGDPPQAIVALAQELEIDLIVMGFEGLHGLGRLRALGSVSRAVMEQTRRPVLIVPAIAE